MTSQTRPCTTLSLVEAVPAFAPCSRADIVLVVEERTWGRAQLPRTRALRNALISAGVAPEAVRLDDTRHESLALLVVFLGVLVVTLLAFVRGLHTALHVSTFPAGVALVLSAFRVRSVTTTFSVRCDSPQLVTRVLDTTIEQHGVDLRSLQWRHELSASQLQHGDETCFTRAQERARALARVASLQLTGLLSCEVLEEPVQHTRAFSVHHEVPRASKAMHSFGSDAVGAVETTRELVQRVRFVFSATPLADA